jgi:tetratricopeptide (TPR) repeat protein
VFRADAFVAEECFQKALEIVEKVYDPNHREIATVLMNLGIVKNAYNKPEEAKALFERALSIYKATFGPNPRTSGEPLLTTNTKKCN